MSPGSEGPQRPPHFWGYPPSQPRLPEQVSAEGGCRGSLVGWQGSDHRRSWRSSPPSPFLCSLCPPDSLGHTCTHVLPQRGQGLGPPSCGGEHVGEELAGGAGSTVGPSRGPHSRGKRRRTKIPMQTQRGETPGRRLPSVTLTKRDKEGDGLQAPGRSSRRRVHPRPRGCPPAPRRHHGEVGHRTRALLSWLQKGLLSAALK